MDRKIPFAIRQSDGQVVGVEDVPRGKAAQCICRSCKRPLIARQGDVNIWHFAHDFSGTTADLCRYSVFESIREAITWLLPQLDSIRVPGVGERPARQAVYNEVLQAKGVDACINIEKFRLLLWLDYPGRHWDGEESKLGNKTGLLSLSIDSLIGQGSERILSIGRLRRWLEEEDLAKRWIYHPLLTKKPMRHAPNRARDDLKFQRHDVISNNTHKSGDKEYRHRCVQCGNTWTGIAVVESATCNNCSTHLYVTSTPLTGGDKP